MILREEKIILGNFRLQKRELNLNMKLTTIHISLKDYKFIKQLLFQGIFGNVSEFIRNAIYHYLFFDEIKILDDRNYDNTRGNKGLKKMQLPVHIPESIKKLVKIKYQGNMKNYNFSICIRQFIHSYIKEINLSLKLREIREDN